MPTGAQLIAVASSQIGVTEKPRGSNVTRYGAWYGMQGVAWCAIFQAWVFDRCGIDVRRVVTPGFASCEMGLTAFRAKHWTVPFTAALPGDLVYFQFDHDRAADHVGLVKSTAGGHLITIEGNTSAAGSQTNGGAVCVKSRNWAQVKGVARVPGVSQSATVAVPVPIPIPPHPNPEAHPPPTPQKDENDMPGYLFSDGSKIWLTDGVAKREVSFSPDRWRELVFLGQARNSVDSGGNIDIPTNPVYLSEIPTA